MSAPARRITLVAFRPRQDVGDGPFEVPCYGIQRIRAAILADESLSQVKLTFIERTSEDVNEWVSWIEATDPDVIGFSVYVWSFPTLVAVARELKARRPHCRVIFGGPSARPEVFTLPPFADSIRYVDAIALGEDGEDTIRRFLSLPELSPAAIRSVPNLAVPSALGWQRTERRSRTEPLDEIASPFQMGLMHQGGYGYLETFRGCPMSCTFCEWGETESPRLTFSTDYLVRELEAFRRNDNQHAYMLDAGLNLNARAFRNLVEADRQVKYFRMGGVIAEIYPTHMQDEHMEFLQNSTISFLGVGLQSFDKQVLTMHQRPFNEEKFDRCVRQLAEVFVPELQIIMGLPGDTPEGFRKTVRRALEYNASLRIFYCLVLPDALLSRGKPEWQMEYDPITLKMKSCLGWTARELDETRDWLARLSVDLGGAAGDYWWVVPPPAQRS